MVAARLYQNEVFAILTREYSRIVIIQTGKLTPKYWQNMKSYPPPTVSMVNEKKKDPAKGIFQIQVSYVNKNLHLRV